MNKTTIMTDPMDEARTSHVLATSLLENKGYQKLMLPKIEEEVKKLTRRILEDTQMPPADRELMVAKRLAWVDMSEFLEAVQRESDRFLNNL